MYYSRLAREAKVDFEVEDGGSLKDGGSDEDHGHDQDNIKRRKIADRGGFIEASDISNDERDRVIDPDVE